MKYGHIPDPPSDKDLQFSVAEPKLIKLASINTDNQYLINEYTPISDQSQLGSCVANSSADALEILMGQKGNVIQLSRLFIYYNARLYHNATKVDDGTCIRYAFDSVKRFGICPESSWSYDESQVFKQPLLEAYKEGEDNSITGYYKISSNGKKCGDDIETAIRANHPVVFGTAVSKEYEAYWNADPSVVWSVPKTNIAGNHAQIIVGIRYMSGNRQFYIRNSWSDRWGIAGHAWYNEDYVCGSISSDFWVPTLVEELVL